MVISAGRGLLAMAVVLGLLGGWAGSGIAQTITPFSTLDSNGVVNATYTTAGTVSAILSQPGAVNGIGGPGSSVVYTYAYYVWDGTTGCDMYGALPSAGTANTLSGGTPSVGDIVRITGTWNPYHQIPEMNNFTSIVQTGTATVPAGQAFLPTPKVWTIPQVTSDIANSSITNAKDSTLTVLPSDLGGQMVTINNVKISGASNGGSTFGTANSPSGSQITDASGNSMTFYYWPTSYSVANQNLANMNIPSGYCSMTGFVSVYGNSNVPEFSPITITPSYGPPLFWQPAAGSSKWDGTTLSWSQSSGQQVSPTGDAGNSAATFDDTGLVTGSTVSVVGQQSASSVVVSNSGGVYLFTGGSVTTAQTVVKNGTGGLLINNVLFGNASVTAGTLGGNGSIGVSGGATLYSLTVGGTAGPAYLTPGATFSTVGAMTLNGTADFSPGGTYIWKLGSLTSGTSGVAGRDWDVLNMGYTTIGGGGYVNFSGSAQLALSFADSSQAPSGGNPFWNTFHTWVIAGSAASAPYIGGSIVDGSYSTGTFSLQGDTSNDLVLKYTPVGMSPRNLQWSANATTGLSDSSGTLNWNAALCTDGTNAGLSSDSNRPDNITFGNPNGTGGVATISLSGNVTVGSLTLNGSNSAQYKFVDVNPNSNKGYLTINNGLTANTSGTLQNAYVYLGASQTWNIASGTLTVGALTKLDYLSQTTVSTLTKTGSGMLLLNSVGNYTGGTVLNGGVISVQRNNGLGTTGSLVTAPGTLLMLNDNDQQFASLSGSGTINVGSHGGGHLILAGNTSSTYSGVIGGTFGDGAFIDDNIATITLAGVNTFSGSAQVGFGGELRVSADANLGNAANCVQLDNNSSLGATASFATNRAIVLGFNNANNGNNSGNLQGTLDAVGSATVLTVSGPISCATQGSGTLTVNNPAPAADSPLPGMLVLTNTANNFAATVLSDGTLSTGSPLILGSGAITFLGMQDGSTLQFAGPGTYANNMVFPVIGKKAIHLDTDGNNIRLTGVLSAAGNESNYFTVDVHKTGSGTLTFACSQPGPGNIGNLYVDKGTVVFSTSAYGSTNASPYGGSGGYTNVSAGATLQLANAQLGVYADTAKNGVSLPAVSLYSGSGAATSVPGATLLASGSSSYNNGGVEVRLNYSGGTVTNNVGNLSNYGTGSVTIGTVNAGDVLSIGSAIRQFDAGSSEATAIGNNGGNATITGTTYKSDPNKLVTIHVNGPGLVQLQSGAVLANNTFGGEWSVDSGVLEVGPYQVSTSVWNGPYGQLFNALGFKTLDGQSTNGGTQAVNGDPDMPNGVTVHGGMFVVAADQVNSTWSSSGMNNTLSGSSEFGVNGTPNYFRNPITLSGGTLAASGNEVVMSQNAYDYGGLPITAGTTAVTAMLGGNFTVAAGTSTIATYDPLGSTGARTVQLLGGSRTLANSTAAYAAGTTLTYSTSWGGTLNVDGGTAGGEFDLLRGPGGAVSVAAGANINILRGATVNVGGTEPNAALYDTESGNSVNFSGTGHLAFSHNADMTYRGNITGGIDLTKSGTGTLELSGVNDYTGATYVADGTLKIDTGSSLPDGGELIVGDKAAFAAPVVADAVAAASSAPVAVPEPGSVALLLAAATCGAAIVWRRRSKEAS